MHVVFFACHLACVCLGARAQLRLFSLFFLYIHTYLFFAQPTVRLVCALSQTACEYTYSMYTVHETKQIGNNIELNNNVASKKNNILNYVIAVLLQMIGYQFF